MQDNIHITSSELGDFVYCPRGWWLRKNKLSETTSQMVKGSLAHDLLSTRLDSLGIRKIIIAVLILMILVLLIIIGFSYLL